MQLKDKVSIITGGGRGIGKAIVLDFLREGSKVAACDVNQSSLDGLCHSVSGMKDALLKIRVDVSVESEVKNLVDETIKKFGKVDILVNNAAILGPLTPITELSKEDWDKVIGVNLTGMFLCSKAVLKHMIACKSGNIINVSSPRTWRLLKSEELQYRVSKYGVDGFTFVLAHQMKSHGICVNAMAPPTTDTAMSNPLNPDVKKRMRKPEEVSKLAVYLALQKVDRMTGKFIDFRKWEKNCRDSEEY